MRSFFSLYAVSALLMGGVVVVRGSLPAGWKSEGCWSDIPNNRTLNGAFYVDEVMNNWENCVSFCDDRHYTYAGVEYGRECYCGHQILTGAMMEPDGDCNMACAFDSYERCGGPNRLNIFQNSANGW